MLKKTMMAGVAALTLCGAAATTTTSAEAQVYYRSGDHYDGYSYSRPVASSRYGRHYGHGYSQRHVRRRNNGGAVAAGVIGGLALGALAAQAAPGYARTCWDEPQQTYNRYGRPVVRYVRVCR